MSLLVERFVRYCKVDTQSDESSDSYPSTMKQFDLARLLAKECEEMGLQEVSLDEHGYVMATLPARLPEGHPPVETIGLVSHMDTSPAVTGANVKPQILRYEGGDIVLPKAPEQVIRVSEYPELDEYIGTDLITTDGTTLLGADDKAGIAEIMTAMDTLLNDPNAVHGAVRVLFTPDEEIGRGTDFLDLERFGVKVAYTMDGGPEGQVQCETFSAASAHITIHGKNVHPGYAKGKMINAVRLMSELLTRIPTEERPETTEGREGYYHPYHLQGEEELATIKVLLRDFELEGLEARKEWIQAACAEVEALHPGSRIECEIVDSYRNMKLKLDERPEILEHALEAIRRTGYEPKVGLVRGGTDGSVLSWKGIPTPNLFTGGRAYHSQREWVPVVGMEKAVEMILHLVQSWAGH